MTESIPTIDHIQVLLTNHNGHTYGGNWCQWFYSIYKDLVGKQRAERAWDVMHDAGLQGHGGVYELLFWAEAIQCMASEIQQLITLYR